MGQRLVLAGIVARVSPFYWFRENEKTHLYNIYRMLAQCFHLYKWYAAGLCLQGCHIIYSNESWTIHSWWCIQAPQKFPWYNQYRFDIPCMFKVVSSHTTYQQYDSLLACLWTRDDVTTLLPCIVNAQYIIIYISCEEYFIGVTHIKCGSDIVAYIPSIKRLLLYIKLT